MDDIAYRMASYVSYIMHEQIRDYWIVSNSAFPLSMIARHRVPLSPREPQPLHRGIYVILSGAVPNDSRIDCNGIWYIGLP